MSMHPELGWRLAQAKIAEARSGTQRASALRAVSPELRVPGLTVSTRRRRWAAPIFATTRSRIRRPSLRTDAPRTTKG